MIPYEIITIVGDCELWRLEKPKDIITLVFKMIDITMGAFRLNSN